jgi:hypothetical protein
LFRRFLEDTPATVVQETATAAVEETTTRVPEETWIPAVEDTSTPIIEETTTHVVEEMPTSNFPAVLWDVENEAAQEMSTIDDGELWWKLAVDAPAQLVTARREESAVVVLSMPARTKAYPGHNISEKLVLGELRKEIEEDVRRTVEEELRRNMEEEVSKKVEEEVRKLMEEYRIGELLALLCAILARWRLRSDVLEVSGGVVGGF